MFTLITTIYGCLFSHTVHDLSDPSFRVRDAASRTIRALGWAGWPLTWSAGSTPEAQARLDAVEDELFDRSPVFLVQVWAYCADGLTDEFILDHRDAILSHAETWGPDTLKIEMKSSDTWATFSRSSVRLSATSLPWFTGSEAGEIRAVLRNLKSVPDERRKYLPVRDSDGK